MKVKFSSYIGNEVLCKVKDDFQAAGRLRDLAGNLSHLPNGKEKTLKKPVRTVICLILLSMLLSALALEFAGSYTTKPAAELSKTTLHSTLGFSVISEERDGVNDHQWAIPAFASACFLLESILPVFTEVLFNTVICPKKLISQNALHIRFCSLRL